jgi:galactonate dehydratase
VRIVRIDTLRPAQLPNVLFVEVTTDAGLVGLGETFFGAQAVEAYVHETAAPYLLGADPLTVEAHNRALEGYLGYQGVGSEARGRSAIDIALWDIWGQATDQPLHALLGGRQRDSVPIYNTCAGYGYVRHKPEQSVANWGLPHAAPEGPYEDLEGFLHRADELAESLLAMGITAMKIWPFDPYAEQSGGTWIAREDLDRALEPVRRIRSAVGPAMEVMIELHGLWDPPTALRITRALEEFAPRWIEDPVRNDDPLGIAKVAAGTTVPIAAGETLGGRRAFQDLLGLGALDVVMLDPGWCGGISTARKIATLAEASNRPVAPHDCTGPVGLTVGAHLSCHLSNAVIQESVRAFYTGWYRELVTDLPRIEHGRIWPLEGPGLGTALRPELRSRADVRRRTSRLQARTPAVAT